MNMKRFVPACLCLFFLFSGDVWAADPTLIDLVESTEGYSSAVKVLLVLTLFSFLPSLVLTMTSFTRLVIVFSLLRHALGTQQAPPNQVMVGLALFMTFFVMRPVWVQVNDHALAPYLDGEIQETEAFEKAIEPLRSFMFKQTRKKDLGLFMELSKTAVPKEPADVPTSVLVPAFITSELKTAFEISFLLYIPFLVIDMVVASVLMSMGMMLLPPIMISLPFKLMLFVLADGWNMVVKSLVESF
jgi:flagellar biosynthetic protein FliP